MRIDLWTPWKTGQICSLHYQHSTSVCFVQLYIEIGGFHDRADRDDNWHTHVLCNALALRLTFEAKRHGDKYRKSVSEWAPNGPTWCVCTERVPQIQVGYRNIRCFPSDFQFQSTKLNKQNEIPTSTTDRSAGQYRASEVTRRDEIPKRESRALSLSQHETCLGLLLWMYRILTSYLWRISWNKQPAAKHVPVLRTRLYKQFLEMREMCQIAYRVLSIAYRRNGEGETASHFWIVLWRGGTKADIFALVWSVPQDFLQRLTGTRQGGCRANLPFRALALFRSGCSETERDKVGHVSKGLKQTCWVESGLSTLPERDTQRYTPEGKRCEEQPRSPERERRHVHPWPLPWPWPWFRAVICHVTAPPLREISIFITISHHHRLILLPHTRTST